MEKDYSEEGWRSRLRSPMALVLSVRKQPFCVSIFSTIYRCISCGADTKQQVNGHIRFMPIAPPGIGKQPHMTLLDEDGPGKKLVFLAIPTSRITTQTAWASFKIYLQADSSPKKISWSGTLTRFKIRTTYTPFFSFFCIYNHQR